MTATRSEPLEHTVRQGECIHSLAERYGMFWETIWNDGANGDLRREREDPAALQPGDVLVVPPQRQRLESRATEQRHRFRRKGTPLVVRLYFEINDEPRADEPYRADVDGVVHEGSLDADGFMELKVPPSARRAEIFIGDDSEAYYVSLGHLDPLGSESGARGRLLNLGYEPGSGPPDDPLFREAVRTFQRDHDLEMTGELDGATLDKLDARHRD